MNEYVIYIYLNYHTYVGSSVNNFGQDDADLDMCLLLPSGADVSSEDRPGAIEKYAFSIIECHM